jgi:hypothetical protein
LPRAGFDAVASARDLAGIERVSWAAGALLDVSPVQA